MKLAHMELWNWRNLAHVEFDLNTRLFVVGPNASGKSSLLDALRFISDVAKMGLREAVEQRGGIRALSNGANGTGPARLAFSFEAGPERRTYELDLSTDRAEDAGSQDIRDYFTGIRYIHPNPVKMLEQGPYDECGTGFTRHAASLPDTVLERAIARIRPVLASSVPEIPCLSHKRIGENDDIILYSDDPQKPSAFTHMRFSEGTLRLLGILLELATLPKDASLVLVETPNCTCKPQWSARCRTSSRQSRSALECKWSSQPTPPNSSSTNSSAPIKSCSWHREQEDPRAPCSQNPPTPASARVLKAVSPCQRCLNRWTSGECPGTIRTAGDTNNPARRPVRGPISVPFSRGPSRHHAARPPLHRCRAGGATIRP